MKKIKRIVSLMVAAIMVIATITPALAGTYDVASVGPAGTTFEVFRVYHWVVRGDTLQNIADRWGTTPASIISFNQDYFTDLAARNVTYGINVKLEPGVRLHIYDSLRARHYVRRGDTLASLAAIPAPSLAGPFIMQTTPEAVRRENTLDCGTLGWFNDLWTINQTLSTTMPLVESDAIGAVYNVYYADVFATRAIFGFPNPADWLGNVTSLPWWTRRAISTSPFGTPIYVTIPVRAFGTPATYGIPLRNVTYYRNPVEQLPWLGPNNDLLHAQKQWLNTFNPAPTNPHLDGVLVGIEQSPVVGIYQWHFELLDPSVRGFFR